MILYLLLKAVLYILTLLSSFFSGLIPFFPDSISNILTIISTMISGGLSFLGYFFYIPVVVGLISLVISWHGFNVIKDYVMKVIGHFIAN